METGLKFTWKNTRSFTIKKIQPGKEPMEEWK